MLTVVYVGEGGVKNPQNHAYVLYGWPLTEVCICSPFQFFFTLISGPILAMLILSFWLKAIFLKKSEIILPSYLGWNIGSTSKLFETEDVSWGFQKFTRCPSLIEVIWRKSNYTRRNVT